MVKGCNDIVILIFVYDLVDSRFLSFFSGVILYVLFWVIWYDIIRRLVVVFDVDDFWDGSFGRIEYIRLGLGCRVKVLENRF